MAFCCDVTFEVLLSGEITILLNGYIRSDSKVLYIVLFNYYCGTDKQPMQPTLCILKLLSKVLVRGFVTLLPLSLCED